MNKIVILTKLSKIKPWVQFSILIITMFTLIKIIFGLSSLIFTPENQGSTNDIKVIKEKLKLVNRKSAELFASERKLPSLSEQIKYAQDYFQSYGLKLTEVSKAENNRQKFQINGKLKGIILSVYDINLGHLLVSFDKITVTKDFGVVDILIFGNSRE